VNVEIHIFLNSALVGGEWSASTPIHLILGEKAPHTHWIEGWVHPPADVDNVKIKFLTLVGLELRVLGRPARSLSLYRLRYPGSRIALVLTEYNDTLK
jgi:hypothetical protein